MDDPPGEFFPALPLSGGERQGDAAKGVIFYPGNIDTHIISGYYYNMTETFTAFEGVRRLVSGPLTEIAPTIKRAEQRASAPIAIFSDATGRAVDLDLRGSVDDMLKWLAKTGEQAVSEPRGRGRPKLGVVAREVTLLPRHWEWLNAQPGGASVALRKLVEAARRSNGDADRLRAARDAAYHFMSAMAGNLANFEEASRALFADDRRRFTSLIAAWPADIRGHVVKLAYADAA
jgi:uncharacterized protein